MLRFLAPYMLVSLALVIVGGVGYSDGALGVPALYGITALAIVSSILGFLRWDLRQHPRRDR